MSMFDRKGKAPAPPPQAPNVSHLPNQHQPQPQSRAIEQKYAEEALRAAQRAVDQVREIEWLQDEVQKWERRALMAEAEMKRLEQREMVLTAQLEQRTAALAEERDTFRFKLHNIEAQFEAAGSIILKCMDAAKAELNPPTRINMNNLADDIQRQIEQEVQNGERQPKGPTVPQTPLPPAEPLPKAVTAGPRIKSDTKSEEPPDALPQPA